VLDAALANVGGTAALVVATSGVIALVLRFRRSTGDEHQQVKWIVAAGVTAVVAVVANNLAQTWLHIPTQVGSVVWGLAVAAVPVATTAAILRYRLYDIDRVVSRSVTYALVTGVIVAFYVGVVALVETGLGFSSSVAVAASTLAAAAAFQPLRRRVQRGVDRRFDRAAYDARRTVDRFSSRLRDEVDVDTVRDDLLSTVSDAIAPTSVSVWLVSA
jgi:multisubunit Na+/H+ antiporter MnhB subunit